MTNKNISSNIKKGNEPFLLKPVGKDYLWGGSRLNDDFSKNIEMTPLAETWECSTHPDGICSAMTGEFSGMYLTDILNKHPEFLGTHPLETYPDSKPALPILIKLIDAKNDLSIQVHPDDEYAFLNENGSLGKSEMWYVLDAAKDAYLIYGFIHDMKKETVEKSIKDGTLKTYLQKVPIKKGDVFFIPAGCIHAIGAGALVAEIQESSNLTYRIYDYGRIDKNGNPRSLHINKALDVINLSGSNSPRQPMRVFQFQNGSATELLCRCKYFQAERVILNTERCKTMARFKTVSNSFQAFLCTDGCGTMYWNDGKILNFFKGDCIFVPANSVEIKMHGKAQLLKVGC